MLGLSVSDSQRLPSRLSAGRRHDSDQRRGYSQRVIYAPTALRAFIWPDFIVREKIFVPLNEPGGIITYSVEGPRQVDIEVHAMPVLNSCGLGRSEDRDWVGIRPCQPTYSRSRTTVLQQSWDRRILWHTMTLIIGRSMTQQSRVSASRCAPAHLGRQGVAGAQPAPRF